MDGGLQWVWSAGKYWVELLRELHFLSYGLGQHREPVLDLELFDFTVPQLATEADKLHPRGM
jgi:hypothetical protein